MNTSTVLLVVVIVLVLLAVIAVVAMTRSRARTRQEAEDRARAQQLREEADATAIRDADLEAREARLEADRARLRAEEAAAEAEQAEQARTVEEARHEDQLREADRLDPEVDHEAEDYRPGLAGAGAAATTGGSAPAASEPVDGPDTSVHDPGTHAAGPHDTTHSGFPAGANTGTHAARTPDGGSHRAVADEGGPTVADKVMHPDATYDEQGRRLDEHGNPVDPPADDDTESRPVS